MSLKVEIEDFALNLINLSFEDISINFEEEPESKSQLKDHQ